MRHLGSLLLALVLAPAIWVLTGVGISKFVEARGDSGFGIDLTVGLAAFAGAGLCYALLILPRLSPFGLVLAGLGLLALVLWRVAELDAFNRTVPADFFGVRLALRYPADGYAAVLALPLVGTLFSARRWRRYDPPPVQYAEPSDYANPVMPAYQTTYPGGPEMEYPTVPDLPTAGHPPPPYRTSGGDSGWPFPNDTETTQRF